MYKGGKVKDSIIIIEAPNKCEKIEKFSGAKVFATKGHFKTLPLENYINWDNYEPRYEFSTPERKKAMDYIFHNVVAKMYILRPTQIEKVML